MWPLAAEGTGSLAVSPHVLDLLPVGVCICDVEGRIRYYNRPAVELWGREPSRDDPAQRFSGFLRLLLPDGSPLPHDATPMAEALRSGRSIRGGEMIGERPDGSRVTVMVNIDPIRDEQGRLLGAVNVLQDISEHKSLVENLRLSEERFRGLTAALPAAVYTTDRDGTITMFNEAAAELWGRRPEIGQERWCGSFRIFRPDDGAPVPLDQCPMAVALRENRSIRGEEIVVERPDGVRRLVMPHPVPLRDASGALVGALNMLVDITDRKRFEDRLHETEARFRAIVEATPDCVKLVAPDGTLLEINATGLAMLEANRPEDVIGRPVVDLIAPEHRAAFREFHERVCRGEAGWLEFDIIGLRGTRRAMETRAVPLEDGAGRLHLAVTRDVTDRKRSEETRNLLAAIVESSDDIIVSKDLDGTITSWNKGAERILGYTAEEVVGKPISVIVPSDLLEDVPKILDRIRRGEKMDHYETKRRCKDGTIIDVSLTVSPIRNAQGRIIGASKVGRDVTEQKRAAEALRKSEERLREANRRKDEFLAMLAHELRNPLSAISSAVQVARRSDIAEQLDWSREVIERQVKNLSRLTDDLLDVSRITKGKIQLRKQIVDSGPILGSAVETVRPLMEERKHELIVSFRPGSLRVEVDPVRLEQIVVNLLTNAAKYTESGGRIWLTAERSDAEVVIRVRDTGVGIPPGRLPEMFELFTQGERSLARSEGGLGIGLTLVKKLVEMHGGSVSAHSDGPDQGSEFTVRLPAVAESRPTLTPAPRASTNGRARHARILVVDDNADSARGLSRLLRLLGHDVRTAHDGLEALTIARELRPEIVLLDIGLPGMDGYQVARQLRAEEACRDSVLVAVSGYGQDEDRRRGREAGFDHHLVKPVDHDALLALL